MKIYQQNICTDCLVYLVNGDHVSDQHTEEIENTLKKWRAEKYTPAGMTDNLEPYFSWSDCDLCKSKGGDRYKYNFFDLSEE